MGQTRIEWADKSWNPVVGCTRVSEGCRNCYAESFSHRLAGQARAAQAIKARPGRAANYLPVVNQRGHWSGEVRLVEAALSDPRRWKEPARTFVCSMSDLFHAKVPFAWIDLVFGTMALCPQHTFLLLTKRPERMREYFDGLRRDADVHAQSLRSPDPLAIWNPRFSPLDMLNLRWMCAHAVGGPASGFSVGSGPLPKQTLGWPLDNVWLGTSAEDRASLDRRLPDLLACEAAVHFLSCEPLLGPINLPTFTDGGEDMPADERRAWGLPATIIQSFGAPSGSCVNWLICGGESGRGARRMNPDWARSLRDQCSAVSVPFFFKQWGRYGQNGQVVHRKPDVSLLDGRAHQEYPPTLGGGL